MAATATGGVAPDEDRRMVLTDRLLPPAEWHRLAHLDLGQLTPALDPKATSIAVVEDASGAIVGCWAAILVVHAEGVWIDPAYRKTTVALKLWRRMRTIVAGLGATAVVTGANSPDIAALLTRKRAQLIPYQEYVVCLQSQPSS